MSFSSQPHRVRSLERQLIGNGTTVVVLTPSSTPEETANGEALIAAARARGSECVVVRINFTAKPKPTALTPPSSRDE